MRCVVPHSLLIVVHVGWRCCVLCEFVGTPRREHTHSVAKRAMVCSVIESASDFGADSRDYQIVDIAKFIYKNEMKCQYCYPT